jgi:hypothetical protein
VAPSVGWRFIHGNYLQTMRIPLKFGRPFAATARHSSPGRLINETMARQFFVEPRPRLADDGVSSGRTRTG